MNFKELGLRNELVEACTKLGWMVPTDIQRCSIPVAMSGKDIIGKAETGGGKTGAFSLPIINEWLNKGKPAMFALVLAPTRELATQVREQMRLLGGEFGLQVSLIMGHDEMTDQMSELGRWEAHVVIATPGRLVALLGKCKAARTMLETIRQLVIDEADRMLQLEFGTDVETIAKYVPKRNSMMNNEKLEKGDLAFVRQTQLFSATFSPTIKKMAGFLLYRPKEVFVEGSLTIPAGLSQFCLVVKYADRAVALFALLRHHLARKKAPSEEDDAEAVLRSAIVFVATCKQTVPLSLFLNKMGASAVALHSQMTQTQREASLEDFRAGAATVLVATDIASRGLDVDHVRLVVNLDLPQNPDWYKHRVGRTARAGQAGVAVTIVTELNETQYRGMEGRLKLGRLPAHPPVAPLTRKEEVRCQRCLSEAKKEAKRDLPDLVTAPDDDYCCLPGHYGNKRTRETAASAPKRRK